MKASIKTLLLLVFILSFSMTFSYGQEAFVIQSTQLVVYRDGVVRVTQRLVVNETVVQVSITVLTTDPVNILATNQTNFPLGFTLKQNNLTINTLGATQVILEYETQTLTMKEATVWTLRFAAPYPVTTTLPEQATIIYLSGIPEQITTRDNRTTLVLAPGPWEISYTLPVTISPTTTTTTTTTTTMPPPPTGIPGLGLEYYALAAVVVVVAVGVYALQRRRPALPEELRPEDKQILQYIAEKGGRIMEAELREKFVLPKTSLWRTVKRLERMDLVKVRKIGLQNEIELVK